MTGASNLPAGLFSIGTDPTDVERLIDSLREQELLLKEYQERLTDNLAVISTLRGLLENPIDRGKSS